MQKYNPPEMFPGSRSVEMGQQNEKKPPVGGVARVTIDLRADGRWSLGSSFAGRFDSSYAPLSADGVASALPRLLAELQDKAAEHHACATV